MDASAKFTGLAIKPSPGKTRIRQYNRGVNIYVHLHIWNVSSSTHSEPVSRDGYNEPRVR